jgi:cytochrome c oxidase cbb3-type subunit I
VAHAHIGVLGFAGITALGGLWYVLPKLVNKPLYSKFLADLQYWLVLIGISVMVIDLTIVGLIQGNAWLNGEAVYRVLPEIHLYYVIRAASGLLIVSGAYVGLYNMVRTVFFNHGEATP